jgi:hypothetical protein
LFVFDTPRFHAKPSQHQTKPTPLLVSSRPFPFTGHVRYGFQGACPCLCVCVKESKQAETKTKPTLCPIAYIYRYIYIYIYAFGTLTGFSARNAKIYIYIQQHVSRATMYQLRFRFDTTVETLASGTKDFGKFPIYRLPTIHFTSTTTTNPPSWQQLLCFLARLFLAYPALARLNVAVHLVWGQFVPSPLHLPSLLHWTTDAVRYKNNNC